MTNPYEPATDVDEIRSDGPEHHCPQCGADQIENCWRSFMTGFSSGDATCTSCNTRLCLGRTPRVVAYLLMLVTSLPLILIAVGALASWSWPWVGLVCLVPVVLVVPLSRWVAFRHRGVIVSPRNSKPSI